MRSDFGTARPHSQSVSEARRSITMTQAQQGAPIPGGKTVLVEFDNGIAWVTMNRPDKRNAVSPTLATEMLQVMNALELDERCKVLVLTGAGEAFCAGMDLKEVFRETDPLSPQAREQ